MNRRGFIHSILGFLALPFLPKRAKAKEHLDCFMVDFHQYRIVVSDHTIWCFNSDHILSNVITLPTMDTVQFMMQCQGRLYWVGDRELWEIQHTEDPDLPFRMRQIPNAEYGRTKENGRSTITIWGYSDLSCCEHKGPPVKWPTEEDADNMFRIVSHN